MPFWTGIDAELLKILSSGMTGLQVIIKDSSSQNYGEESMQKTPGK